MSSSRRNIMLGTAGHVDHGKSALVKLLTGCETDTLAEEKERGLTIDLGFAPCRLADNRVVGIVDVPGHVDFIRNMVAGAHGVDVVIFVVAADDGIMPQTHEHLQILTLMGLQHGLVALTKIDLVPQERREAVTAELRRLLGGTFLAQAPICPISNITGEGFERFFEALNQVVGACGERSTRGVFRMWVEDVFTIRGAGTVITGIPNRGAVRVQDGLQLLPPGQAGRVRRMQVYGEDSAEARAGECVALNIPELDHEQVRRGMLLCGAEMPGVSMAEAELRMLGSVKGALKDLGEAQFHIGTAAVPATVALLEAAEITAGATQFVQLRWDTPLTLLPGERFVLRANVGGHGQSGLVTIGGGRILATSNTRLRRRKNACLAWLGRRRAALDDPLAWCELTLNESRQAMSARQLEAPCFARAEEIHQLLLQLQRDGKAVQTPGSTWASTVVVDEVARKILEALRTFHATNVQSAGVAREQLHAAIGETIEIFNLALSLLLREKTIRESGAVLAVAGWTAQLREPEQKLADEVAAIFKTAGWAGPTAAEVAARLGQPVPAVEKTIRLLGERAILVRLDAQLCIHRDAVESARKVALGLLLKKPTFSTMDFRDALGVSRKYAVPLLDYLDKIRFTVRNGHDRSPGVEAKKLLAPAPKSAS